MRPWSAGSCARRAWAAWPVILSSTTCLIVAKRVGAGLPALPPPQAVRRRRRLVSIADHHLEDGVFNVLPRVDLALCRVRRDAGVFVTSRSNGIPGATLPIKQGHRGPSRPLRRGGILALALPPGMAATACREVPFAAASRCGRACGR